MDLRWALRHPLEAIRRLKLGVWGCLLGLGYVGFEVASGDASWKLLGTAFVAVVFITQQVFDGGMFRDPSEDGEELVSPRERAIMAAVGLLLIGLPFLPIVSAMDLPLPLALLGGMILLCVGIFGVRNVQEPPPLATHPAYLQRPTPSAPGAGDAPPPQPHANAVDGRDATDASRALGAGDAPFQEIPTRSPADPETVRRPAAG